jgi:hypothetical protein
MPPKQNIDTDAAEPRHNAPREGGGRAAAKKNVPPDSLPMPGECSLGDQQADIYLIDKPPIL